MPSVETITTDVAIVLANLALVLVIGLLGVATKWLKAHVSAHQFELFSMFARASVKATAQVARDQGMTDREKRADAEARVSAWLTAHGYSLTEAQIDTLIERAVKDLKTLDSTIIGGSAAPSTSGGTTHV